MESIFCKFFKYNKRGECKNRNIYTSRNGYTYIFKYMTYIHVHRYIQTDKLIISLQQYIS